MRGRLILLLSLGLNIAFALILIYSPHSVESLAMPNRSPRFQLPQSPTQIPPKVLVRKQFFSWSEIESEDYAKYIENLRSIDCPEPTIRDIIEADVNQLYAKRRAKEVPPLLQNWWQSRPDAELIRSRELKLKGLDDERRSLLAKLLGPGWERVEHQDELLSANQLEFDGPALGALSWETKELVQQLVSNWEQKQKAYIEAQNEAGKKVDLAELARMRQQLRTELAQSLNPGQMEEFLLRYSDTADRLRANLDGFNANSEEFRRLFKIRDDLEQQIALYYGGEDAASTAKRQQLLKQQEESIKQALGPERAKEYQMNLDPLFREARELANVYQAPADKVLPVYEVNRLAAAAQAQIKNDTSLSIEERERALQLISEDQKKSIRSILGNLPAEKPGAPPNQGGPPMPEGSPTRY